MVPSLKKQLLLIACFVLIGLALIIVLFSFPLDEPIPETNDSSISLLFLGDFMIGDSYSGSNDAPFMHLNSMLYKKDEIIVNLETSVTKSNESVNPEKTYVYKMDPTVLETLVRHNITMVNLANNHIMDYGKNGFEDTIQYLQQAQLSFFGAGNNLSEAHTGLIKSYADDTTIGYLGYFEYRNSYDTKYHFYAKEDTPGVASISKELIESDISWMKNNSDMVIVSLHQGSNYETEISNAHQDIARYVIDCGADAVVCHSAHIVLPIEFYKEKPIFYSVGNFIFTTPGRFRYVDELYHAGLGVKLGIKDQQLSSIEMIAFKTNNQEINYQPCFLNHNESIALFDVIIPNDVNATITGSTARIFLPITTIQKR